MARILHLQAPGGGMPSLSSWTGKVEEASHIVVSGPIAFIEDTYKTLPATRALKYAYPLPTTPFIDPNGLSFLEAVDFLIAPAKAVSKAIEAASLLQKAPTAKAFRTVSTALEIALGYEPGPLLDWTFPSKPEIRTALGIPLTVSTVILGIDSSVHAPAFFELASYIPDSHLILMTRAERKAALQTLADGTGVAGYTLVTQDKQASIVMQAADLVVHLDTAADHPLYLYDAAYHGVPVAVPDEHWYPDLFPFAVMLPATVFGEDVNGFYRRVNPYAAAEVIKKAKLKTLGREQQDSFRKTPGLWKVNTDLAWKGAMGIS